MEYLSYFLDYIYIYFIFIIIIFIIEISLYYCNSKIILYCGITFYKKYCMLKRNYFVNNVGNKIVKDDVYIKVINENLCFFQTKSTTNILGRRYDPLIFGYIKIVNNNYKIIYKKPFSYIIFTILYLVSLITIFGIESIKNIIYIFIWFLLIIGPLIFFNYLKVNSMKYDIEYFINNGK